jgi:uncharacterized protein Yka (UPF0111/DUF47 family)
MRFRVQVEPKQTVTLAVEEARPLQSTYALTNVTSDQVDLFVRQQSIDKTVEEGLRRILLQKGVVADLNNRTEAFEGEKQKIFDDQQRLRENMKALKGSVEEKALLQRYTRQLNDQENRLEAIAKEVEKVEKELDAAQGALERLIQQFSVEVKI